MPSAPVTAYALELVDGRALELDVTPLMVAGQPCGLAWQYRDVSAQRRALGDLEAARAEADRSSTAKDLFVASLSHELRSQLHSILGNVELLRETSLDEAQVGLLRSVRSAARSQLALISDLLDLSALRAGTFSLDPAPFTLQTAAAEVVAAQSELGRIKGLEVTLELDHLFPDKLYGDARRFGQVLTNLVANAVRYCDAGHVRVRLIHAGASGTGLLVRCEVEDTGTGVAVVDEPGLFKAFHRAADPKRQRGGTGLGLAICRQIVETMGGVIGYLPTPGGGATFWFTARFEIVEGVTPSRSPSPSTPAPAPFSRAPSQATLAAVRPLGSSTLPGARRTLMVVEDTPTSRIWARRVLESRGYEVIEASSGLEALDLLATRTVDLILMDWQMPGMDGLEATRQIRRMGGPSSQVPILGLSANAGPRDLQTCLDAGMNGCLFKPVTIVDLVTKVAASLEAALAPSPAGSEAARPAPADDLAPSTITLAGLPPESVRELAELFHEGARTSRDELDAALAKQDVLVVQRLLHRLIGMTGNLGYRELKERLRTLQARLRSDGFLAPFEGELRDVVVASCDAADRLMRTLEPVPSSGSSGSSGSSS